MLAFNERCVFALWALLGNLLLLLAVPFYALSLVFRPHRLGRCRQRLAFYRRSEIANDKNRSVLWIHAVSTGELLTARPLLRQLKANYPAYSLRLSAGTDEAYRLATTLSEVDTPGYLPLDVLPLCRRAVRVIRPAAVLMMETEIWPNFIRAVSDQNVPIFLLNARIDDRAYRHYRCLRRLFAPVVKRYTAVLAQTAVDQNRFRNLGATETRLHCFGNLKVEAALAQVKPAVRSLWRERLRLQEADSLLLGGSTFSGEEACLLKVVQYLQQQRLPVKLALAPRHIERAASICREVQSYGMAPLLRSRIDDRAAAITSSSVIIIDTLGELPQLYAAADIVFIGKSLYANGGQNPLEPAAWGKAIVFGPNMQNFRTIAAQLLQRQAALSVADTRDLGAVFLRLIKDKNRRTQLGENAGHFVQEQQGALAKTMLLLSSYLTCPENPNALSPDATPANC